MLWDFFVKYLLSNCYPNYSSMKGVFSDDVVFTMLQLIRDRNIYKKIDGRKVKNSVVYEDLAKAVNEHFKLEGTEQLTGAQVNTKWKSLKSTYHVEKSKQNTSGEVQSSWKFFKEMQDTMGHRPCANNVSNDLHQLEAAEQDDRSEEACDSSQASTSSLEQSRPVSRSESSSVSRKRKSDSDFEAMLCRLEKNRRTEMQALMDTFTRQNEMFLGSMSNMFSGAMQMFARNHSYTTNMQQPPLPQQPASTYMPTTTAASFQIPHTFVPPMSYNNFSLQQSSPTHTPLQQSPPTNPLIQQPRPTNTPPQLSPPTNSPPQQSLSTNTSPQQSLPTNTPPQQPLPTNTPPQQSLPTNAPPQQAQKSSFWNGVFNIPEDF